MHYVVPTYYTCKRLINYFKPFSKIHRNLQITFFVIFENIKSLLKRIHLTYRSKK